MRRKKKEGKRESNATFEAAKCGKFLFTFSELVMVQTNKYVLEVDQLLVEIKANRMRLGAPAFNSK